MFGIVYLISILLGIGTAKVVTSTRDGIQDNQQRDKNKESWDQTYFDHKGYRRDCKTGCRVETRINEQGDEILYELIGGDYSGNYRDLRNLSEIKRQIELKKNIEEARKNGKTVARKYDESTAFIKQGLLYRVKDKDNDTRNYDIHNVPTCKNMKWNKTSLEISGIKGDRYQDINTGEEYVIRVILADRKTYMKGKEWYYDKETYFYMSTSTMRLIRRTDNQLINDKNGTSKNAIGVEETEDFIKRFNDAISQSEYSRFEYNGKEYEISTEDVDCFIKEKPSVDNKTIKI